MKIRKLVLFDAKCPNLGTWAKRFQKPMSSLKSKPSIYGTSEISEVNTFWLKMPKFGHLAGNFQNK